YGKDGSLSYFIKRFDRYGKGKKWATEDFAQLTGNTRDTKYRFTMEKLIPVLDAYCSFPAIEKADFFKRMLFCFLTGKEDMNLKNLNLKAMDRRTTRAPMYDALFSTRAMKTPDEDIALTVIGKTSNLKATEFIDYGAKARRQVNAESITIILEQKKKTSALWK